MPQNEPFHFDGPELEALGTSPDLAPHERERPGLADLLDYDVVVAPGVVGLKGGGLLGGFRYRGPDSETATSEDLADLHRVLVRALSLRGDGWAFHYDLRRSERPGYPASSCHPDAVGAALDDVRRRHYESQAEHFLTEIHLCWSWVPPAERRASLATLATGESAFLAPERQVEAFDAALVEFRDVLRGAGKLERLDTAALLEHVHASVTGHGHPIAEPAEGVFLDQLLASEDLEASRELQVGDRHLVPIGFMGPPERELAIGLLDELAGLRLPCRFSVRLLFLDPSTAQGKIEAIRGQWSRAGLDWKKSLGGLFGRPQREPSEGGRQRFASRMAEDADEALSASLSGERFVYVTPTVLVEGPSRAEALERAGKVLGLLRNAGLPARIETLNAVQSWLAQLPGNTWSNRRRLFLPLGAASALLPQTTRWAGRDRCPHPDWADRPPLAVVSTATRESYSLNLHVGDVGHTLIFGPTGAGKSVLLNFLISSFRRYGRDAAIYSFDVGYSQLAHCLAAGGRHYDLGEDGLRLAPLARLSPGPRELASALEWVQEIVELQGVKLGVGEPETLEGALRQLAQMPTEFRTLTNLQAKVQSEALRKALHPYTSAGSYGHLLDGSESHIAEENFLVFEMGQLLRRRESAVAPVLLHLFEEIRRRLDGRPTLILVEEGSVFLANTRFAREIREWLVGLRKLGAAVVFTTQSVAHVLDSQFLPIFLESCPSKIFLPNPRLASTASLRRAYETIGLSPKEIALISEGTPKRDYVLSSPEGTRLFRLELSAEELAFYGVSRPPQIRRVRELIEVYGAGAWVPAWCEENGLDDMAAELRR